MPKGAHPQWYSLLSVLAHRSGNPQRGPIEQAYKKLMKIINAALVYRMAFVGVTQPMAPMQTSEMEVRTRPIR